MKSKHCQSKSEKHKLIVCYHFFPHYRGGVIKEIDRKNLATFVGDEQGVEGIKPFLFSSEMEFKHAKCFYFGKLVFQPKVVTEAIFGDHSTYVFLANPNHVSTWLAAAICRLRRRRVIFWGHGFKSPSKNINNRLRKFFFSIADAFYAYGFKAKENAVRLGFNEEDIYVGFNSLDYSSQLSMRKKIISNNHFSKSINDGLNVACISRLTKACQYDMLFKAISVVSDSFNLKFKVTIIGDGPERISLENMARDLGIDACFLGPIYEEEKISDILYKSDVTISPGKVGLTAMHSLMYGTPVISHDDFISQMPEVEAIVPGFTGELFEYGSISSLAETLVRFSSQYPDREVVRKNCFAMVDRVYNPSKQMEILQMAIEGIPALRGDDAFILFDKEG